MNIKYRKIVYKIPGLHSLCKLIVNANNARFYNRMCKKYHHDEIIRSMRGSKINQRCFIVGNGPSLTTEDLALLKNEVCFASNLIFRIFDKTEWRPTFYFLQDRYADTEHVVDELNLDHLFIGDYYWRTRGMDNPNAVCFHCKKGSKPGIPPFSEDISQYIVDSHTVTYSMIQCAAYLGYTEIYLLGMDHNFALVCDADGNVVKGGVNRSHIFEDKNPQEVVANLEGMNKAYIAARDYAKAHGILIANCTRGGELDWFERISLEDVLSKAADKRRIE